MENNILAEKLLGKTNTAFTAMAAWWHNSKVHYVWFSLFWSHFCGNNALLINTLRVPFGHPPFEKISNNVDFSLWGKQCICPTKMRPKLWKSDIVSSVDGVHNILEEKTFKIGVIDLHENDCCRRSWIAQCSKNREKSATTNTCLFTAILRMY